MHAYLGTYTVYRYAFYLAYYVLFTVASLPVADIKPYTTTSQEMKMS